MVYRTKKGVALLTVITIVFILTILSTAMISLISSQTRFIEHGVARTKAKYANEAAMVRELERLRLNTSLEATHSVSGKYDNPSTDWIVSIVNTTTPPISGISEIDFTVDYNTSL